MQQLIKDILIFLIFMIVVFIICNIYDNKFGFQNNHK